LPAERRLGSPRRHIPARAAPDDPLNEVARPARGLDIQLAEVFADHAERQQLNAAIAFVRKQGLLR